MVVPRGGCFEEALTDCAIAQESLLRLLRGVLQGQQPFAFKSALSGLFGSCGNIGAAETIQRRFVIDD